jgi:NADH-quinone oxidoreductase subunit H
MKAVDMTRTQQLLADDPLWLILLKVVVLFVFGLLVTIFGSWAERRIVGRMQNRPGPNRAGPFGALIGLADGLKLAFKEDIMPAGADRVVYFIAPVIVTIPAFTALSVIPFGGEVTIFGEQTVLQLADLPVGLLVVLACSSLGVYGIVLGGWAAGSPYPLLGGVRSAAQMISYELPLGLAIAAVLFFSGSLSTADIVDAQAGLWFAVPLFPSFVIFVISMVGETNRAPFDLPEAESELVGGFHTEYSSLKFALYMLAEYTSMAMLSAIAATLFLGGSHPIWPLSLWGPANNGWFGALWMLIKIALFLFGYIWLRGSLPRMRYDQFMRLSWKVLIPVSLLWILVVAAVRVVRVSGSDPTAVLIAIAVVVGAVVLLALLMPSRRPQPTGEVAIVSDFPLPPLDLVVPPRPARNGRPVATSPPQVGVDVPDPERAVRTT